MSNRISSSVSSVTLGEISGVFTATDGHQIDLGVLTSPYSDRFKNELWKKRNGARIRLLLNRDVRAYDRIIALRRNDNP